MRDFVILLVHIIVSICRLWQPDGTRSLIAESVLLKQQLLILNRSWKRVPNLRVYDRIVVGLCTLFIKPTRLIRSTIVLKTSTLLNIHNALNNGKYRIPFFLRSRHENPVPKDRPKNSLTPLTLLKAISRTESSMMNTHHLRAPLFLIKSQR
jgi:putative transposase